MSVTIDQNQGQYTIGKNVAALGEAPTAPTKPKKVNIGNNPFANLAEKIINKSINNDYQDKVNKYNKELAEYNSKLEQAKLWDREDEIRKETQEREDTAITRQVQDMINAGINPNLMNVTGAPSGGGITQGTSRDYTLENTLLQGDIDQAIKDIEIAFQADQNAKDRLNRVFTGLGIGTLMKIK